MKQLTDKALGGLLVGLIALALIGGLVDAIRGAREGDAEGLLPVGAPAPAISAVRHADGKQVGSADLAGKVVVLDFWATWCPPCREEAPVVRDLAKAYAQQPVVFLALDEEGSDGDPRPIVSEFLARQRLEGYPVAYPAPGVDDNFQVTHLPTLYVIGKDGAVRFRGMGAISGSRIREAIDAALKG